MAQYAWPRADRRHRFAGPIARSRRHAGRAWVVLSLALGLHVADEAYHDFLSVFNPALASLQARLPWVPFAPLDFDGWVRVMGVVVALLLALSVYAYRGASWVRPGAYVYGGLMLANGLGHVAGSFTLGRPMPGVYSAPLLVGASLYLLWGAHRLNRRA